MKWLKSIVFPGASKSGTESGKTTPEQLRENNEQLIAQLRDVVTTAAENDEIWRHFMEIERLLLRSREFDQLTKNLLQEVKNRFRPDLVVLYVGHPEVLERFFPELEIVGEQVEANAWIRPLVLERGRSFFDDEARPKWLDQQAAADLLNDPDAATPMVQSAILVPLTVHELFFGSLLLGSQDAAHYAPSDGTDLLEQLGAKIALCMDNCLAYERVKDLSDRDHLTDLLNFFQIHTVLEREFRRARRSETDLSVLAVELDFVEETGDHLDMGGPVLRHVANLLKQQFPDGNGFIGRQGSHEFLIVMPYATAEEALEVAENLSETIRRSPLKHSNAVILIRPRIGVASLRKDMDHPHDLLDAAMSRLYQAKTGNRVVYGNGLDLQTRL